MFDALTDLERYRGRASLLDEIEVAADVESNEGDPELIDGFIEFGTKEGSAVGLALRANPLPRALDINIFSNML